MKNRVFDPHYIVRFESVCYPQSTCQIKQAAKINSNFHFVSRSIADSLYPIGTKEVFNILPNDFLFTRTNQRQLNGDDEDFSTVKVMGSVNGRGGEAKERYPQDEEQAKSMVMNTIKYIGTSRAMIKHDSNSKGQSLSAQIRGVHTHRATHNMPMGVYVMLRMPPVSPSEYAASRATPTDVPLSKRTLEAVPYHRDTALEIVSTHLLSQLHDPERYKASMNLNYRTTDAWINFGEVQFDSAMINSILFMYRLVDNGILNVSFNVQNKEFDLDKGKDLPQPARSATSKQTVIGLAKALGLLTGATTGVENISIGEKHKENYKKLRHDLLATMFYDGTIANLGVGYDRGTKKNKNRAQGGKIMKNLPEGKLLERSLNHWRELISAYTDTMQRHSDTIAGKVIKSGKAGSAYDILS